MEWSNEFYAWRYGENCPSCAEGRPDATTSGARYFAGELCDAYPVRADIQRGLSIAVFRRRHVVEPTELSEREAAIYGREVLRVAPFPFPDPDPPPMPEDRLEADLAALRQALSSEAA